MESLRDTINKLIRDVRNLKANVYTLSTGGGSGGGVVTSVNSRTGAVVLTKTDVGLSNVTNTSDTSKPVSTAQATAIGLKEDSLGNPGTTGQVLASTSAGARSWVTLPTGGGATYTVFDSTSAGLAPQRLTPLVTTRFLREDGTWVLPTNTTYTAPTQSVLNAGSLTTAGLISPKLLNDYMATRFSSVDVTLLGAVGNGVTDDTLAIQGILSNPLYTHILFPPGKTFLVSTLTSSVANRTIIAYGATIKLKNTAAVKNIFKSTAVGGITILGGTWDGNKANNAIADDYSSVGISLYSTDNNIVKDAIIKDTQGIGIACNGDNNLIQNNIISGSRLYGIFMDATGTRVYTKNRAISNDIDMSSGVGRGQGVLFTSAAGGNQIDWEISGNNVLGDNSVGVLNEAINLNCRGNKGKVFNNTTKYGCMGFSEGGDDTIISGNTFTDLVGVGFGIEPSGSSTITNNIVKGSEVAISASLVSYYFDRMRITGNTLESTNIGIAIVPSASVTAKNILIASNTIVALAPIELARNVAGMSIKNNTLIGTGKGASRAGVTLDNITQPSHIYLSGNSFRELYALVSTYSASAVTFTDISILNSDTVGIDNWMTDVIYVQGASVIGGNVKLMNNGPSNRQTLDLANNLKDIISYNGDPTPEGVVTAGVGSTFRDIFGVGAWYKRTGAGNTGWFRTDL